VALNLVGRCRFDECVDIAAAAAAQHNAHTLRTPKHDIADTLFNSTRFVAIVEWVALLVRHSTS